MKTPRFFLLLVFLAVGCRHTPDHPADTPSPYAGEQARAIKALSESEIEGYLTAQGMGMARAAELNHYPGPKHVLALADDLNLTDDQRAQTQQAFEAMQVEATSLGGQIVEKERALDALFADKQADTRAVRALLRDIGALKAELRFVHLNAHLKMKDLLTENQVQHYDQLRGYNAEAPPGQHSTEMHH